MGTYHCCQERCPQEASTPPGAECQEYHRSPSPVSVFTRLGPKGSDRSGASEPMKIRKSRSSIRDRGVEKRNSVRSPELGTTGCEAELLAPHRRDRRKGMETRRLIVSAMKQDRVCAMLDEVEIETILETMEFFQWVAQDHIVRQGDVGTTFFVAHDGKMEVTMNGRAVNTISKGQAFGGPALLYNCPRTKSVTARTACSAWCANGDTFHKVLKENANKAYAQNRKFLDSVELFRGLDEKQKDRVVESFFNEVFEKGSIVVTEAETPSAMYLIRSGVLKAISKAEVLADGCVEAGSGKLVGRMKAGEVFGERAFLSGTVRAATVVAEERSELLCIGGDELGHVLGGDLRPCLERNIILGCLKKSLLISQFSAAQHTALLRKVQIKVFQPGESIPTGLRIGVVCEGEVVATNHGDNVSFCRGGWFEEGSMPDEFPDTLDTRDRRTSRSFLSEQLLNRRSLQSAGGLLGLVAGENGARVGCLSVEAFLQTLREVGLGMLCDEHMASDFARKLVLVKKVQLFEHLPQEAIEKLVAAFEVERFAKNDYVFKQGDAGDKFYVIASGEVSVLIGDKLIRTMPRNQFIGERALLFDESRSASVQCSTQSVELWSISKLTFKSIITEKMRQEMVSRIKLQDTSVTMKDLRHVRFIGAGSAGTVRLVEHQKTKTRYALKRVQKDNGAIPDEVSRECALLAENDHPFIMTLVKTFETNASVYMLTELITGGDLHAAIRTMSTVLTRPHCQFYGGSLLLVIEELHERNILYRDLKPENVMLDAQGYLKLIDFGIAKKLDEGTSKTFTMIGTPHYMAPEVIRGRGYGAEADVWSFGCMMFEFACGYLPFGDDLEEPTEVCTAVLKDTFRFPDWHTDSAGKTMMQRLLSKNVKKRLGAGVDGLDAIKNHDYFQVGRPTATVFSKIMARELDPPVQPHGEVYSDELDDITLSDEGELA